MINVLVAEDSAVAKELIIQILDADKEIKVIGTVENGRDAVEFVRKQKPNVITMDVNMPVMNGIEATESIMETDPTPIIITSTFWNHKDVIDSFTALQSGAVCIAEKPAGSKSPRLTEISDNLIHTIKQLSAVKIINPKIHIKTKNHLPKNKLVKENGLIKLIGIGGSVGGPVVIKNILSSLNDDFSVPIIVVQHIQPGFTEGFIEWLGNSSRLALKIAEDNEIIRAGQVYIAPDFNHLIVTRDGRIRLISNAPINGIRPSISYFFESLAEAYGKEAVGILLTGIGKDGSSELKMMRDAGAITIVQDCESSMVWELPGTAVNLNAASYIYSPDEILGFLNKLQLQNI